MTSLVPARRLVQMPWSPLVKIMPTRPAYDPGPRLRIIRLNEIMRNTHTVAERPLENLEVGEPERQIGGREAEKPKSRIERELIASRPQQDLLKPRLHDLRQRPFVMAAQDERILGEAILRGVPELAIEFHLRVNPSRIVKLPLLRNFGLGIHAVPPVVAKANIRRVCARQILLEYLARRNLQPDGVVDEQ